MIDAHGLCFEREIDWVLYGLFSHRSLGRVQHNVNHLRLRRRVSRPTRLWVNLKVLSVPLLCGLRRATVDVTIANIREVWHIVVHKQHHLLPIGGHQVWLLFRHPVEGVALVHASPTNT